MTKNAIKYWDSMTRYRKLIEDSALYQWVKSHMKIYDEVLFYLCLYPVFDDIHVSFFIYIS